MSTGPLAPESRGSAVVVLLAAILVVLVVGGGIGGYLWWRSTHHHFDRADNAAVGAQVQSELQRRFNDDTIVVFCPGPLLEKAGYISDCTATQPDSAPQSVRVTMDDGQGHFSWRLTAPITLTPKPRGA